MRDLDNAWKLWVAENLARGCSPEEIVKILMQNGFALQAIRDSMGAQYPSLPFAVLSGLAVAVEANVDFRALANVAITKNESAKPLSTNLAQLFVLPKFMSVGECTRVIEVMNNHLRPSEVTVSNGDNAFRTSSTCDLGHQGDDFIKEIDHRIAETIGIPCEYSEVIQGQKYEVGQEFKAHTDYFEPKTDEYKRFAEKLGQRTWTFMVYLNEPRKGGETHFTRLNAEFKPEVGTAVVWNNLSPTGTVNPSTIHHAKPVLAGQKYVITKWFRTKQS